MESYSLTVDLPLDLGPSLILSATGLVSNILNVITFWRMGFRESSNISLLVIAVEDCVKCFVALLQRGYALAGLFDRALGVNWVRVFLVIGNHVQNFGVLLVNMTIMYLTIERCLCLCLPFKVRSLVTARVTVTALGLLIGIEFASMSPTFATLYFTWVYEARFNQSMVQYMPTDLVINSHALSLYLNVACLFWTFSPFAITVIATFTIIYQLRRHGQFRAKALNASGSNPVCKQTKPSTETPPALSGKETRLVKMLLLVTLIYFIQILPRLCMTLAVTIEPQFYVTGEFSGIFLICYAVMFLIDLLMANAHLFIYLSMSSQYRTFFFQIFTDKKMILRYFDATHPGLDRGEIHLADHVYPEGLF